MGGFVEDFTPERIGSMSSNIVISKGDDSVLRESIVSKLLVGMEDIRLMPVVLISF